jgi:CHAT domain-containing protein
MRRRLIPRDDGNVANAWSVLGSALGGVGRLEEALTSKREALDMRRRLFAGDHPSTALDLHEVGGVLQSLGREGNAVPYLEEALAMRQRLFPSDHRDVAESLGTLASTYAALGRAEEALPLATAAVGMSRRLFPGGHARVGRALNVEGFVLQRLGRLREALARLEESLATYRATVGPESPEAARDLSGVAMMHAMLGDATQAVRLSEESLALRRRVVGGDHPDMAVELLIAGRVMEEAGRPDDAAARFRESVEVATRTAASERHLALAGLGRVLLAKGDAAGAAEALRASVEALEGERAHAASLAPEERARFFSELRRGWEPFGLLVEATVALGRPAEALGYLERGRARGVLDLLDRGGADPLERALAQARERGDESAAAALEKAVGDSREAEAVLLERRAAVALARRRGDRESTAAALTAEAEARRSLLAALDRRHRSVRERVPEASTRSVAEIQALLGPDDLMLVYSLGSKSFLFVVPPPGKEVRAVTLAAPGDAIEDAASEYAQALSKAGRTPALAIGAAHPGRRLFEVLVPPDVWAEVKGIRRLHVVPHGALHRIPFEALVVGPLAAPAYWVDAGPPVAYVPSGSVLAWLRDRRRPGGGPASLVAVGDPEFGVRAEAVPWPEAGVLVTWVDAKGQAARLGVRAGDVLVEYAGKRLVAPQDLQQALAAASAGPAVTLRLLREADPLEVAVDPGRLGIRFDPEPPPVSGPRLLAAASGEGLARGSPFARDLPPLPGARSEVEALAKAFRLADPSARVVVLTGAEATESRLHREAKGARYLHLATHGLVDESEAASFSCLALTSPRVPVPGDDGFLTLLDLVERWRGRLDGTDLVVLSACRTHRGRLERDEGVFALTLGFALAGCPSAVASLWKADDDATASLMRDFYASLLAEREKGKCEALARAIRAAKKAHPDPYYWAPFVFVGDPR